MKILLADDHALLRHGLKQILAREFPEAEFCEAGTGEETLNRLRYSKFDVVVLDIFMPGRGGLDILGEMRANALHTPVIVLSSAPEEQLGFRVLRAGAQGYLNKQTAPENLVGAVKKVLSGGIYASSELAERVAVQAVRSEGLPHENLSDREFQVMQLLLKGDSIKAIAAALGLSSKTISTFHTRIWEKLHVRNDVELMRYAVEHQLIQVTSTSRNAASSQ
jgi:two-component system invasion response regulator UvrY